MICDSGKNPIFLLVYIPLLHSMNFAGTFLDLERHIDEVEVKNADKGVTKPGM